MASVDRIISVVVNRTTTPVTQAGFGAVLLLSSNAPPGGFGSAVIKSYNRDSFASDFTSGDEFKFLSRLFGQNNKPERVYVGFKLGSDADYLAALTRINNVNSDWYCVCLTGATEQTTAEKKEVSDWVGTQNKIAFLRDINSSSLLSSTITDLGSVLNSARTAVFWTANKDDYLEAAVAGECLPQPAGSLTFAYKALVGVPVPAALTTSAENTLSAKNVNYYASVANRNLTFDGKMSNGDFIDTTRSIDWITARIMENVFQVISTSPKIPYSDAGVEILANASRQTLDQAINRGVIFPNYTLNTVSVRNLPVNDRANRVYGNINVDVRLTGAIQKVNYRIQVGV